MATYKLSKDHFLQAKRPGTKHDSKDRWLKEPQLHEQGATIEFDGPPSLHMEPLDKEATERVEARRADWNDKKAKGRSARAQVGWSPQFGANMERIIERSTEPDANPMSNSGSGRSRKKAA